MALEAVARRIQEIKIAREVVAESRNYALRCDRIRERELFRNLSAIREACQVGITQIQHDLSSCHLELHDIPSSAFRIRKPHFPAVTIDVEISSDGAVISIQGEKRFSANNSPQQIRDTIRVQVGDGDLTYYTHGDESIPLHVNRVAEIVLAPILAALT